MQHQQHVQQEQARQRPAPQQEQADLRHQEDHDHIMETIPGVSESERSEKNDTSSTENKNKDRVNYSSSDNKNNDCSSENKNDASSASSSVATSAAVASFYAGQERNKKKKRRKDDSKVAASRSHAVSESEKNAESADPNNEKMGSPNSSVVSTAAVRSLGSDKKSCNSSILTDEVMPQRKAGGSYPHPTNFPERLMHILENSIAHDAVWWLGVDGDTVAIHSKNIKESPILNSHFQGNRYTSFIRNLNRW